ncbi:MAG: DUF1501 domain-containing protein [Myxococcota bacterium]
MGTALLTSLKAHALPNTEPRFIFVFCPGGWDPTRVFAPEFDNPNVDMELDSFAADFGDLRVVSNPNRPSVDAFFVNHASDVLIINGVQVRSIAHEICTMIALSGSTSGREADWATRLAGYATLDYPIPHLNLSGPAFAGNDAALIARTGSNSQLDRLLSGAIKNDSDIQIADLNSDTLNLIDQYIGARGNGRLYSAGVGRDVLLSEAYVMAHDSAQALKAHRRRIDFQSSTQLISQVDLAVDVLRNGFSRCISLAYAGNGLGWDSHADNDAAQSGLFEGLFAGLMALKDALQNTVDTNGQLLSDNTYVVVASEMGRTPQLNATLGKDHWPYTSMMLWGPRLKKGITVGGLDGGYQGQLIDYSSGEISQTGQILNIESVGAGLLKIADIDPTLVIPDAPAFDGLFE